MKFTLRRVIREGDLLPRWYGIAWYADWGRVAVCYPLGLHRVVDWARRVWWALHGPGALARRESRAYSAGYAQCEREYRERIQRVEQLLAEVTALHEGRITATEIIHRNRLLGLQ